MTRLVSFQPLLFSTAFSLLNLLEVVKETLTVLLVECNKKVGRMGYTPRAHTKYTYYLVVK